MSSAAMQYLREVNRQLLCPASLKKPFLRQLENEALCYCADHSDADLTTLSERFGAPVDVAEAFLAEFGDQLVSRCIRTRKRLQCMTVGIALLVAVIVAFLGLQTRDLQQTLPDGEMIASITYDAEADNGASWLPLQDIIFSSNADSASPAGE